MNKKEFERKVLKLKKKCGFWGRGYVRHKTFEKEYQKLLSQFKGEKN